MKKTTKKAQILSLLATGKTPQEVAKKAGVSVQRVYTVRHQDRKTAKEATPVRRGRPRKVPLAWSDPAPANVLQKESQLLSKVILEDKVEALNIEVTNLKHQIIGFRAVISYLEDLAGVRNSQ